MKQTIKKARVLFLSLVVLLGTGISAQTVHTVSSDLDNGEGTLRQLIVDAFPGDSIVIPAGYTIVLESVIEFNKSLSINGQGSLIRVPEPGVSEWRLFMLGTITSTPNTVGMYNLNLEGGHIPKDFAAIVYIRQNHTFTMKNCNLSKGKGTYAGAIFTHKPLGTTINLENCTFSDCEATTSNGGAIIVRGVVKINNCVFENNKADLNGGAIAAYDLALGSLITNCRFIGHETKGPTGSAIINYSGTNSLDLEN